VGGGGRPRLKVRGASAAIVGEKEEEELQDIRFGAGSGGVGEFNIP